MKRINETYWMLAVSAVLIFSSVALALWQGTQRPVLANPVSAYVGSSEVSREPIQPIPLSIELDEHKVALGRQLFHDPRLSRNNTIACATCHILSIGGMDQLPVAVGIDGIIGHLNTPTVFNSGFNFRQFWDGRADSLENQIAGPIHNLIEMASNWDGIIAKLGASPDYISDFAALYRDGITPHNVTDAVATFERSLYTPNSRFDQFLRGDVDAISAEEQQGYNLFITYGCASCHQGVNVGGNLYQPMGVVHDYFADRGGVTNSDLGLFNVTAVEADRFVFKVPSLRMVSLTAPYFHDGSVPTLNSAVEVMAYYQLGRTIPDNEVDLIVQFLGTLAGENPELNGES
jgi:cytochrome c peroxidase